MTDSVAVWSRAPEGEDCHDMSRWRPYEEEIFFDDVRTLKILP